MRYDAKTVTTDLIEELFHILPFPIKNTFMIAFNQHEGPGGCSEMNPFSDVFRLVDRLAEDEKWAMKFSDKLNRKIAIDTYGKPPQVAKTNPEIERGIREAFETLRGCLDPDHWELLDSRGFKRFVAAVREANLEHRQSALTLDWIDRRRKEERLGTLRHFAGVAR